jgi:hypothetical protein
MKPTIETNIEDGYDATVGKQSLQSPTFPWSNLYMKWEVPESPFSTLTPLLSKCTPITSIDSPSLESEENTTNLRLRTSSHSKYESSDSPQSKDSE